MNAAPLLEARDLVKHFALPRRGLFGGTRPVLRAVDGVSFHIGRGETLALVGESGCGKTTLARMTALLHAPTNGTLRFNGQAVTGLTRRALKPLHRCIQMVFQDPHGSLNPRLPVGDIIAEPLVIHDVGNRAERRARVSELAASVGLRSADMDRYPHQFSGGQRQRIAIARALALEPSLVVADEPVSALDVSIQSQILNLLKDLQAALGLAYLFVSHDLAVVRYIAGRVAVMYLGTIVEEATADDLFANPRHPYTRALIAAAPVIGKGKRKPGGALTGDVPSPVRPPPGCRFHTRCPLAQDVCRERAPLLEPVDVGGGHRAACHFKDEATS